MTTMTALDRMFMEQLANGPRWMRSFNTFRPIMRRLLATGHAQPVHPPGGKCANMIGLTAKGALAIGIDPPSDSMIDRFAERLSEHGDVSLAAREIGTSPAYGRVLFQRIIKQLGWQAS